MKAALNEEHYTEMRGGSKIWLCRSATGSFKKMQSHMHSHYSIHHKNKIYQIFCLLKSLPRWKKHPTFRQMSLRLRVWIWIILRHTWRFYGRCLLPTRGSFWSRTTSSNSRYLHRIARDIVINWVLFGPVVTAWISLLLGGTTTFQDSKCQWME